MIDVNGLPEENIKFLRDLVEEFRTQVPVTEPEEEEIIFETWPLGVKDKPTNNIF